MAKKNNSVKEDKNLESNMNKNKHGNIKDNKQK